MIWAIYFFSCKMFFVLSEVVDLTTISRLQSLTLVKIVDCTLRVPDKTAALFRMSNNKNNLYSLKAIYIHVYLYILCIVFHRLSINVFISIYHHII